MLRAGELNRRITVQKNEPTADSTGQMITAWTDLGTVWAQAIMSGGKEFYAAQKVRADTTVVFRMRFTRGITPVNRIIYEGRTFEILSVIDPDGLRNELHISAKEVV